jgi:type IV pilus assembly protein PilM
MEIRHVVLEEKEAGAATQLSVLLVAAPKTLLYRYYNIFEMAGLKLTAVDLPALNLWRVFSGPYCAPEIKSTQAVVDIGSSSSYFIVVKNNRLTYVRSIYTGGSAGENSNNNPDDDLTIVYGRELPPSDGAYAEAAATVEYGGISGLVNYDQYSDFITEVRRSLDFYRLQDREAAIEQLVITGGGSKAAHLSALLENELGIAVKAGHASFSPGNGITDLDPQFTMAFGLALGEVPR